MDLKHSFIILLTVTFALPSLLNAQSEAKEKLVWLKYGNKLKPVLYKQCENSLKVEGKGRDGKPIRNMQFTAKNAKVVEAKQNGWVSLYAFSEKDSAVLYVHDGGTLIDSLTFPVERLPNPDLFAYYNNEQIYNLEEGICLDGYNNGELEMRLSKSVPYSYFANEYRFIFADAKVTLARGTEAISTRRLDYMGKVNIHQMLMQNVQSGDRLIVEVSRLIRIDSQENNESFKVNAIWTIPLYSVK